MTALGQLLHSLVDVYEDASRASHLVSAVCADYEFILNQYEGFIAARLAWERDQKAAQQQQQNSGAPSAPALAPTVNETPEAKFEVEETGHVEQLLRRARQLRGVADAAGSASTSARTARAGVARPQRPASSGVSSSGSSAGRRVRPGTGGTHTRRQTDGARRSMSKLTAGAAPQATARRPQLPKLPQSFPSVKTELRKSYDCVQTWLAPNARGDGERWLREFLRHSAAVHAVWHDDASHNNSYDVAHDADAEYERMCEESSRCFHDQLNAGMGHEARETAVPFRELLHAWQQSPDAEVVVGSTATATAHGGRHSALAHSGRSGRTISGHIKGEELVRVLNEVCDMYTRISVKHKTMEAVSLWRGSSSFGDTAVSAAAAPAPVPTATGNEHTDSASKDPLYVYRMVQSLLEEDGRNCAAFLPKQQ